MRLLTRILLGSSLVALLLAVLLAGAPSISAQQTPPSNPPPPPNDAPKAKPISPSTPPPPPPPETSPDTRAETPKEKPIDPSTPPPPPPDETAAKPAAADTTEPAFDPYHAQKSLDVGTFYMKTGRYDAAIDRFQEAARYEPSLAMPWRLLGETYERQHAYALAVESYKKYLEVFPTAADAAKITKQISVLEEKVGKESPKDTAR
jgi:tetratricopeptide (TPR) repeat protein